MFKDIQKFNDFSVRPSRLVYDVSVKKRVEFSTQGSESRESDRSIPEDLDRLHQEVDKRLAEIQGRDVQDVRNERLEREKKEREEAKAEANKAVADIPSRTPVRKAVELRTDAEVSEKKANRKMRRAARLREKAEKLEERAQAAREAGKIRKADRLEKRANKKLAKAEALEARYYRYSSEGPMLPEREKRRSYGYRYLEGWPEDQQSESTIETQGYIEALMHPEEVERMERSQKDIYRHYISPTFLIYLKKENKFDRVIPAFDLAVQYPDKFKYNERKPGVVEITKRSPYAKVDGEDLIPDDFRMVIEHGYITQVGPTKLKDAEGGIPWQEGHEFNQRIASKQRQFLELTTSDHFLEEYDTFHEMLDAVPQDLAMYFEVMKLILPHHIGDLIEKRNETFQIDPDRDGEGRNSAGYQEFLRLLENHPESIDEMKRDPDKANSNFHVGNSPDRPNIFDVYAPGFRRLITVDRHGYLRLPDLEDSENLSTTPNPHYNNRIPAEYYRNHPKAKEYREDAKKPEVRDSDVPSKKQILNLLEGDREKKPAQRERISFENLKNLMLRVGPANRFTEFEEMKESEKNRQRMIQILTRQMEDGGANYRKRVFIALEQIGEKAGKTTEESTEGAKEESADRRAAADEDEETEEAVAAGANETADEEEEGAEDAPTREDADDEMPAEVVRVSNGAEIRDRIMTRISEPDYPYDDLHHIYQQLTPDEPIAHLAFEMETPQNRTDILELISEAMDEKPDLIDDVERAL
jgi:hypothetical protein